MAQMVNFIPETFFDSTLSPEEKKPVRICSVYPKTIYLTHGPTTIVVPECEPGMECAKSDPIGPACEKKDYGNNQLLVLECIPSRDNALDALGLSRARVTSRGEKINARTTSDWFECGLFVPEGDEPSPKEIADARARLLKWAGVWLNKGDETFAIEQKAGRVDYRSKLAARILKTKRGWSEGMVDTGAAATIPCPSCRLPIIDGATKCPACGDRFVYVNGRPMLKDDAGLASQMPSTPPPQKAQQRP